MNYYYILIVITFNVAFGLAEDTPTFVTQTVYGFLDFTTTIGNTVMVFSPQSAPTLDLKDDIHFPVKVIETKPLISQSDIGIKPTKLIDSATKKSSSNQKNKISISKTKKTSDSNLHSTKEIALQIENNLLPPEYDLLSRQPVEYAEETFRLINHKTSLRSSDNNRVTNTPKRTIVTDSPPVGLVVKLSGTELKDGMTTAHETSVIGTYISGKYAQVLQSSSHVLKNKKSKIRPTSSLRVLKTAAPSIPKSNQNSRGTNRQNTLSSRLRNKNSGPIVNSTVVIAESTSESAIEHATPKKTSSKSKRRNKGSRTSNNRKSSSNASTYTVEPNNRRSFRPKIHPSTTETDSSTSLYMFKLNRTPGRWQYKSTPKPRINIRKYTNESMPNNFVSSTVTSINDQINNDNPIQNSILQLDQGDLESSGSQNGAVLNNVEVENKRKAFVETLNVEISTPSDFKDTYFEIATIKTPFTFQAGVVKKTRFITVTSTFEKILKPEPTSTEIIEGPLTENILASSTKGDHLLLDGSVTTLAPIHLTDDAETPSLETITETFSLSQTKLRTQILPIIRHNKNDTMYLTLVQTYDFTSFITATKTLSPLDGNQFIPSKNFKDFGDSLDEAGSEINLELEFGDEDINDNLNADKRVTESKIGDFENTSTRSNNFVPSPIISQNLNPDQIHQLALLNLLNPTARISPAVTASRPVIKLETIWETHVVPVVNGASTVYRTLSKSIGVVDNTEYAYDTATLPPVPPPVSVNPFLLPIQQPQPFHTITTALVHETIVTQTNSKVLKLTFGAKTAYTTIFSTAVLPTSLTMFITTSLPVQPTAAFPGYYPPPYPPYAYVG